MFITWMVSIWENWSSSPMGIKMMQLKNKSKIKFEGKTRKRSDRKRSN